LIFSSILELGAFSHLLQSGIFVHIGGDAGTQLGVSLFLIHLWAPRGAHRRESMCARLHLSSVQPIYLEEILPDALEIAYAYAKQHVDFAAMFFLIRFDSFPFTKLCFAQVKVWNAAIFVEPVHDVPFREVIVCFLTIGLNIDLFNPL
jgi:hypothetical protein